MALTFNGASSGLSRAGNLVATYPFTVFAWTRAATRHVGFVAELAADPGPNGVHEGHGALGDGNVMRAWSSTGGSAWVGSERPYSVGDWVPCMVVFANTTSRKIYYGNGNVRSDSSIVPQNPAALNAFAIGRQAVKNANYWNGDIACVGIWSTELSASDYTALAAGTVPSTVRTASLVDYWSLQTQAATQTGVNGRMLAATGTTQASTHPISESPTDTQPPTMNGTLSASAITGTSYTLSWSAATDNVGVTSYQRSLDGGASWVDVGNVLNLSVAGRTSGTTDAVRVRARDAAGNVATTPLALSVTLPDVVAPTHSGTITVSGLTSTAYNLAWPAAVDNVGIVAYDVSLNGGTSYSPVGNVLSAAISGRTPGTSDAVRVRARDAAGNVGAPLATTVTLPAAADTTPPVLTGSITVSALTSTSYTLAWPAGSDNVGVTAYERSLDAGVSWVNVGNVLTVGISGRTPGAIDQVRVRARDAAGNVSSPALSASVTLPGGASATLVTPPLKNNTGTVLANLTGIVANVYNTNTGALVLHKTGLSSSATGVVTINDAALVSGTSYAYEIVTPSNGRRLPTGTAA